jgi:hypothetical protein
MIQRIQWSTNFLKVSSPELLRLLRNNLSWPPKDENQCWVAPCVSSTGKTIMRRHGDREDAKPFRSRPAHDFRKDTGLGASYRKPSQRAIVLSTLRCWRRSSKNPNGRLRRPCVVSAETPNSEKAMDGRYFGNPLRVRC